jgi:hypothetical protein
MNSVTTAESDVSAGYLEVNVEEGGCVHSPIIEVATPVSPAVVQPFDPVPMSPLEETCNEDGMRPENVSEDPDPLLLPLPPSPLLSPSPTMDPADPVQLPENPQDVDPFFHDDEHFSIGRLDGFFVVWPCPTSRHDRYRLDDSTSRPNRPTSTSSPSTDGVRPGPDSDEDEEEMPDLYIPALIAPTMFLPIPNVRLSYFFRASVDLVVVERHIELSSPVFLDRPFVYAIEQIHLARAETDERFDWRVAETRFSFVGRKFILP